MRLLNTSTLGFTEVFEPDLPPYAIVSHTWTADEINHQEFVRAGQDEQYRETVLQKTGFAKIERSCRIARESGLSYLWIDTCCIDKTSTSELSEAINSMFRWYQYSTVCYVYLEDVDVTHMRQYPLDALSQCRWITRGWCLQELLAPDSLQFYDKDWQAVVTKHDFAAQLSQATNIDVGVLSGSVKLGTVVVARRMSWASSRRTTRLEDQAYCLMGIFDVTMPMLYGEGSKAFLRLQHEIFEATHDLTIFAWSPPETCHDRYLPLFAPSPKSFASCATVDAELGQIIGSALPGRSQFSVSKQHLIANSIALDFSEPSRCNWLNVASPGRNTTCALYLKKVGPGLFVRIRPPLSPPESSALAIHSEREEQATIYLTPDPVLFPKFDAAHALGIQIRIVETLGSSLWIQRGNIQPASSFDFSRSMFLAQGTEAFAAYLGCAVRFTDTTIHQFVAMAVLNNQGRLWADLVQNEVLDNMARSIPDRFMIIRRFAASNRNLSLKGPDSCKEIRLSEYYVRMRVAKAWMDGQPIFRLNFAMGPLRIGQ